MKEDSDKRTKFVKLAEGRVQAALTENRQPLKSSVLSIR
jgi:hypothetical protein